MFEFFVAVEELTMRDVNLWFPELSPMRFRLQFLDDDIFALKFDTEHEDLGEKWV